MMRLGLVLSVYTQESADYNGLVADVLLLQSRQILRGVWVQDLGGGVGTSGFVELAQCSGMEIAEITKLLSTGGPIAPYRYSGAMVLVDNIEGTDINVIVGVLRHARADKSVFSQFPKKKVIRPKLGGSETKTVLYEGTDVPERLSNTGDKENEPFRVGGLCFEHGGLRISASGDGVFIDGREASCGVTIQGAKARVVTEGAVIDCDGENVTIKAGLVKVQVGDISLRLDGETVKIETPKGNTKVGQEWVAELGGVQINAKENKIEVQCQEFSVKAEKTLSLEGTQSAKVKSSVKVGISGVQVDISGSQVGLGPGEGAGVPVAIGGDQVITTPGGMVVQPKPRSVTIRGG
jgi:hypothetical protein